MKQEQKEKAIELLKRLDVCKPFIERFESDGTATMFEGYIGFWVDQYPDVMARLKEIEKKYNSLVYAVTHEFTTIGEMYSFLLVPSYQEEWESLVTKDGNDFYTFAYVWNKSDDDMSELGYVVLDSKYGGVRRIG